MQGAEENTRGGVKNTTLPRSIYQPQYFEGEALIENSTKAAGRSRGEERPAQATGGHDVDCVSTTASLHAAYIWPLFHCIKDEGYIRNIAAWTECVARTLQGAGYELLQAFNGTAALHISFR
jgi:hypothetical protein